MRSFSLLVILLVGSIGATAYGADARVAVEKFLNNFVGGGGHPESLDEILSEDYVQHSGSSLQSREDFKAALRAGRVAAPDIQASFRVLEYSGNRAILFEVITGTHNGLAPLFGIEPSGRKFSFTNLHIFETRGDRISRHWTQPFLGEVMGQLTGQMPAKTAEEIWRDFEEAMAVSDSSCLKSKHDNVATWYRFRNVMQSLDHSEETLTQMLVPSFRLSTGNNLNQDAEGVRQTFTMAGTIGRDHENSGLDLKYVGEKFVAAFGPVRFTYDNPEGAFNLPASQQPIAVAMNELQIIGTCNNQVFHQFSFADVLSLMGQIMPLPRSRVDIAIDFLRLSPEEVRGILADDFKHESPVGSFDNADDFVAHFATHEPEEWSVEINEIMETEAAVYVDYNFVVGDMKFRMVDRLVIEGGLCREGHAFFLKMPNP